MLATRRLLPRHGQTLGSPENAPVHFLAALRTAVVAVRLPLPAARSGSAAPGEGPGRDSLPGDRFAGTDAPAEPQKAWGEAAAIRAGNRGDSAGLSGRARRVGFAGGCVRVSPCPRTAVGAGAAGAGRALPCPDCWKCRCCDSGDRDAASKCLGFVGIEPMEIC